MIVRKAPFYESRFLRADAAGGRRALWLREILTDDTVTGVPLLA
ncbi:hypothetical protein FIV07_20690 [Mycobacterium sp. THAF192]|nr:hypothetical protein FIV07_20690 [Mycobacterium sp. THAF192]